MGLKVVGKASSRVVPPPTQWGGEYGIRFWASAPTADWTSEQRTTVWDDWPMPVAPGRCAPNEPAWAPLDTYGWGWDASVGTGYGRSWSWEAPQPVQPSSRQLPPAPPPPRSSAPVARPEEDEQALAAALDDPSFAAALKAAQAAIASPEGAPAPLLARFLGRAAGEGGAQLVEALEALCCKVQDNNRRAALDVGSFSQLLRRVVLDMDNRSTAVRVLLNLAVTDTGKVVPLVPEASSEEEAQGALLEAAAGKPEGVTKLQEEAAETSDAEGQEWPEELMFRGCTAWPELNARFKRTRDYDQLLQERRPVYEHMVEAPGHAPQRVLCFYWSFPLKEAVVSKATKKAKKKAAKATSPSAKAGWWLGTQVGGEKTIFGACASTDELPPGSGWSVRKLTDEGERKEDPGGFVRLEDLGVEALRRLDLPALRGCVQGPDAETTAYFGHFCTLLHLEYLTEVATLRRRLSRRAAESLQKTGWALTGLRAKDVLGKGKGKGKGKSKAKGKGKPGGPDNVLLFTLAIPGSVDIERLRFRKGDCVIVSNSDPLVDKLGEGCLQELGDGIAVVALEGVEEAPADWKESVWRLDKGTNRLSYSRQLESLVALCGGAAITDGSGGDGKVAHSGAHGRQAERPKIFQLLTTGGVGQVDFWAQSWRKPGAGADSKSGEAEKGVEGACRVEGGPQAVTAEPAAPAAGGAREGDEGKGTTEAPGDIASAVAFPMGTKVVLKGLQAADMNGLEGVVVRAPEVAGEPASQAAGRVSVKLARDGSVKAIRPENLQKVEPEAAKAPPPANPPAPTPPPEEPLVAKLAAAPAPEPPHEALERCRSDLAASQNLNPSQAEAISAAFTRRCTIIQGPPGTGKTTTAVHVLKSWAAMGLGPLLATADGNVAVDNIAEGLVKLGVNVVRVGRPEKVTSSLEDITLDARLRRRMAQAEQARAEAAEKRDADNRARQLASLEQLSFADIRARAEAAGLDLSLTALAARLGKKAAQPAAPAAPPIQAQPGSEACTAEASAAAPAAAAGPPAASLGSALDAVLDAVVEAEGVAAAAATAAREAARSPEDVEAARRAQQRENRREYQELQLKVLKEAEVICAQMISAGGGFLARLGPFHGILVDEVAQATELAAIVPMVQRGCERLVLAGDHCQLPPTVQSPEAERRGLTLSLYSRLVGQGVKPFFLDTQFRSHPKLAEFSAEAIYEGRLKSGISAEARPHIRGFDWPKKKVPIAFVEAGRAARENEEGESKMNSAEAQRVLATLEAILEAGECSPGDIGVVTPYVAQVRSLRTMWRQRCNAKAAEVAPPPTKKRKKGIGSPAPSSESFGWWTNPRSLEIASVDHFQGREKELIIFSAVRNNGAGRVGFLADWRRLNVMLTRARRGLIVVGNAWTLRHDPYWARWLDWCANHSVIIDAKEWHDIVGRAMRSPGTGAPARKLLKQLFQHDSAPLTAKAFKAFALRELEGAEAPSVEATWDALVEAREARQAAVAATAAARAAAALEPEVWGAWSVVVHKILEENGGRMLWKDLRGPAVAAFVAARRGEQRPAIELKKLLRATLPTEYTETVAGEGGEGRLLVRLPQKAEPEAEEVLRTGSPAAASGRKRPRQAATVEAPTPAAAAAATDTPAAAPAEEEEEAGAAEAEEAAPVVTASPGKPKKKRRRLASESAAPA